MPRKPKQKTLTQLKRLLDLVHSRHIRLRAANDDGLASCVTCGTEKLVPWTQLQAGHFVSRRHQFHRWDLDNGNVNPQCVACNRFDQGRQWAHGQYIDQKHGEGSAAWLWQTRKTSAPMDRTELEALLAFMLAFNTARIKQIKEHQDSKP